MWYVENISDAVNLEYNSLVLPILKSFVHKYILCYKYKSMVNIHCTIHTMIK